jgi:hypothetical protein
MQRKESEMTEQKRNDTKLDAERQTSTGAAGAASVPHASGDAPPAGRNSDKADTRDASARDARGNGAHMMASAGAIGDSAVSATRDVLRGAIGATEDVASGLVGGVTHVAADLVHGVHDIGLEVRDGATGLIGAVGVVGGAAVNTVAHLLADVVDGVRYVVGAALPHNGNGQARQAERGSQDQAEPHTGYMQPPDLAGKRDTGAAPPM